ncbi:MAG TPA: hypothetical protein VF992_09565 [Thermoplasmata archaeon]
MKASATKFKEIKNTLDARQRELEAVKAEIESQRADLEGQVARFRSDREEFEREKGEVQAARALAERDIAGARLDREKIGSEEKRIQDWARALNDREKTVKESEDQVRRLQLELTEHLRDSESKMQALVEREELSAQRERALADTIDRLSTMEKGLAERDRKLAKRDEELIKLQNERLNALESRERELLKISEEMLARQKESDAQHDAFVEVQSMLRQELTELASQREMLATKEKSLLDAEKYLAAALEAGGLDLPTEPETKAPPPPPVVAMPPRPPTSAPTPPTPPSETLRHEFLEEDEGGDKPKVSRADALERMTRALETAKRARDTGRNVSEIRKALKQARAAFESGDYDTASRLADDILRELEDVPLPR